MKKMLLATALGSAYYRCAQTDCQQSKTKPAKERKSVNQSPSFQLELSKKTVDAAKICGGAENVVKKTETQQTFVNGLLGFITLGIYTSLEARVLLTQLHELPIDMGNSICTAH